VTLSDCRGLDLSTSDRDAVDTYDAALELFLNYEASAGQAVKQLLADHSDCVMGSVIRGYMMLMIESTAVQPKIAELAGSLSTEATNANQRERLHIAALAHWAADDVRAAAAVWDRILAADPHDLLALKVHHYTTFWTGRASVLLSAVEGVLDAWDDSIPGFDHVLGMHSFGLNETGHYGIAERVGREAVARNSEDLWSVHAVAHALEMQGDLAAGDSLFDVDPSCWDSKNPFRGHIWWHAALFAWNGGDYDRVLRIFDDRLHPISTNFYLDIQNLSSILARLELVGVDVAHRWDELGDHAANRTGDHVLAFTDVHCALSLARAGRLDELEAFTTSLIEHQSSRPAAIDTSGIDVAIKLSECLAADAAGDPAKAAAGMRAIRGELAPIGGSHAQRDLFDLLLADATQRAGDLDMAVHLLGARSRRWPSSVPTRMRYAEALSAAGSLDRATAVATERAPEASHS